MHESLKGLWSLAEILWKRHYNWARQKWERRPNLGRRRTISPNSLIHESAYQRGGDYARHLPPERLQQAEQGFWHFPPSAGSVMRSHSITLALRVTIGPKIDSFGHWQLSAGETC